MVDEKSRELAVHFLADEQLPHPVMTACCDELAIRIQDAVEGWLDYDFPLLRDRLQGALTRGAAIRGQTEP